MLNPAYGIAQIGVSAEYLHNLEAQTNAIPHVAIPKPSPVVVVVVYRHQSD